MLQYDFWIDLSGFFGCARKYKTSIAIEYFISDLYDGFNYLTERLRTKFIFLSQVYCIEIENVFETYDVELMEKDT